MEKREGQVKDLKEKLETGEITIQWRDRESMNANVGSNLKQKQV